eukprot:8739648-Alexandrium_andersonii.AAC.1
MGRASVRQSLGRWAPAPSGGTSPPLLPEESSEAIRPSFCWTRRPPTRTPCGVRAPSLKGRREEDPGLEPNRHHGET